MPTIAVVLVSYNTRDYLARALTSIYASPLPPEWRLHVVVVDNASQDGSVDMVLRDFLQVDLVASSVNLGFTGGNNLALARLGFAVDAPRHAPLDARLGEGQSALPQYVLLLNPDAELVDDALPRMVRFMAATPNAGVCGAQLSYGDGSFQHGAFRFPGLGQILIDFFPLTGLRGAHRLHNSRFNGRYPAAAWQGTAAFRVDFVLGAAMLVRGAAIQQIGGLDDGYFMYCEEMDWCLRAQNAGWGIYALPAARVIHHEGRSSRQVRWSAYERLWRSRLRFYAKYPDQFPTTYRVLARAIMRVGSRWRMVRARRRFASGVISGTELQEELSAHATVAHL